MQQKEYREIAAIPSTKPYVSHMQYHDSRGQSVTLFPAFRSVDTLHDISRMQSPIKLNTVPLITRNQDKWANQYHEIIREYGPPKNDPENLFLFGKDELYRSESSGNPNLKPSNNPLKVSVEPSAPLNPSPPPAPPPPPPRKNSITTKYQRPFTRQPSGGRRQSQTFPKMRYIYAFPEEFRHWIAQPTFTRLPPESSSESEQQRQRRPSSLKKRYPIPAPRQTSFEKKPNPQYENLPAKSIVEEIKERIKAKSISSSISASSTPTTSMTMTMLNRKKEMDELQPPAFLVEKQQQQQISPETFYSTTNASQFSYQSRPPPPPPPPHSNYSLRPSRQPPTFNESFGDNSEIGRLLKDTPSHILPIVQSFISSHFENPQKALDHSEFSETEIPMKHYWQRIFKVKDGKKNATIKIENLLSIEPEIGPFHGFQQTHLQPPGTPTYRKVSLDTSLGSGGRAETVSMESGISTISPETPPPPQPKKASLESSSPISSIISSSASSEMDLLTVVLRKIRQRKPIDWPELFLLKNDHCRFVVSREKELRKLRKQNPVTPEATLLERDIVDNYRCYQRALEQVIVVDELYTKLAYFIMRAESYWYAAKVTSDKTLRHHFYALARHNYADLLVEARAHLAPDDRSLLTILEKMTQILVESGAYDPELAAECQKTVFLAEKALETANDVKRERKIIKIKTNLLSLNSK